MKPRKTRSFPSQRYAQVVVCWGSPWEGPFAMGICDVVAQVVEIEIHLQVTTMYCTQQSYTAVV